MSLSHPPLKNNYSFTASQALLDRARKVIPSATQTFSKGPNQWVRGVSPHYLARGEGAWVWDVDGNRFLDYLMALGPIILGYGHHAVDSAVIEQVRAGPCFSQMHPLEVELAEMLVDLIPGAEMVRFAKNGSDATGGAVRCARAYTGRERVALCGYHGWHDWYIGTTTRDLGVPDCVKALSHTFVYNDLASLEALFDRYPGEFACVTMEPVGVEAPADGFLEGVRDLCDRHGALLVFDEIVTGFRVALGGAQSYFGVRPDISCFGKAMANGYPLAAVVGPREIMDTFDRIFFSGTFGGEAISLAAGKATIEELRRTDALSHIRSFGEKLTEGLNAAIARHGLNAAVRVFGLPVRSVVAFPGVDEKTALLRRSFLMQECVKRGLLYFCSHIPCYAHGEAELAFTLDVLDDALAAFADAWHSETMEARLEGLPVEAIFRRA